MVNTISKVWTQSRSTVFRVKEVSSGSDTQNSDVELIQGMCFRNGRTETMLTDQAQRPMAGKSLQALEELHAKTSSKHMPP
jgi:hypothetical protein